MPQEIKTITLPLPYRLGTVNCYLATTGTGFVLIDTGGSNKRTELENELASAGCKPGNLDLIVLAHGDFDHTGNCTYLRDKFGAKVAMHQDDSGMAEHGDLFCGDLLENYGQPALSSIMDDPAAAETGIEKLKTLEVITVYPGHGQPFPMELFLKGLQENSN